MAYLKRSDALEKDEKRCNKCGIDKPLSDYAKRSKKAGDYKGICKDCERPKKTAAMRDLRKKNPEYRKRNSKYQKRWAQYSPEEKAERNQKHYIRRRQRGEEYKFKRRILRKKFYHKDIEKSRDRQLIDWYRRKGLSEELIAAHVAVAKVKRAINGRTTNRKSKAGNSKTDQ